MEYHVMAKIPRDLDAFTRGYLECAEWCGLDDSTDNEAGESNRAAFELSVTPEWSELALLTAECECGAFQRDNAADLSAVDLARAGHDFWLTRNRHGAGFWDGGYPAPVGRRLTEAAHRFGEQSVSWDLDAERLEFEPSCSTYCPTCGFPTDGPGVCGACTLPEGEEGV